MTTQNAQPAPPLDDMMLAMDVVDTLRHRQDLVERELNAAAREERLIERLREIYRQQGIEVPDHILKEGVAALAESRFAYTPPERGWTVALARVYVSRSKWGKWALASIVALALLIGGYHFAYKPYQAAQAVAAHVELTEDLPAEMDALYTTIFEETKVQSAVERADDILSRGKAAVTEGDREAAHQAVDALRNIRDTLRQEYQVRVVNREGVRSGFWTFPEINTDATNYYLVVEAIAPDGNVLSLPVVNEETGETEDVSMWGVRVDQYVYEAVAEDKRDDGIIQRNIVGLKQYGYLDVDYIVPVLGGAVTRW